MARRTLRLRSMLLLVAASAVVLAVGIRWLASIPEPFPVAVGRSIPARGTLTDLRSVGKQIQVVPSSDPLARHLGRRVRERPGENPEGWREDDTWAVCYSDGVAWDFQFRGGRLVNYDPAIMAKKRIKPMESILAP